MNRSISLALRGLLLATAFTSMSLHAGEPAAAALKVTVGDLDLTKPAGIEILYQRLQYAARQVCGPSGVTGTRLRDRDWDNCVHAAVDNAVRQIDRPALTAYHRAHAGESRADAG
jgi:UrcA family protein